MGCSLGVCGLYFCGGVCDRLWNFCGERSIFYGVLFVMEKMLVGFINKWGESYKIIMGVGSIFGFLGYCFVGGVVRCLCGICI